MKKASGEQADDIQNQNEKDKCRRESGSWEKENNASSLEKSREMTGVGLSAPEAINRHLKRQVHSFTPAN